VKQSSDANTTAEIANARAVAANDLASQALDLQRAQFLADAASDAGKARIAFELRELTVNGSPAKYLSTQIVNTSPHSMNGVTLTVNPCQTAPSGIVCSSADPTWEGDLGVIPACTQSVFGCREMLWHLSLKQASMRQ
jgi:hypothetical protein